MPTRKSPRKGSLQFWPRKRARKYLPSVNWNAIDSGKNLKGFICYKVGMKSAIVKDETADSMTKGKVIATPVTILECPPMKILSVRFYKDSKVAKEILSENLDKELKKKIKIPKTRAPKGVPRETSSEVSTNGKEKLENIKIDEFENIRVICYSVVKKTNLKKKPDICEFGLKGSVEEQMNFVKAHLGKEILVSEVFAEKDLADLRGLTTGRGLQGPVKRFGITLKSHKSEKGRRRPGSLGPWHPARVTFRAPQAGQVGMFTRAIYNNKILKMGNGEFKGIKNYGDVKTDYIILRGSVQGPSKRQIILTHTLRPTKKQTKKELEVIEIR